MDYWRASGIWISSQVFWYPLYFWEIGATSAVKPLAHGWFDSEWYPHQRHQRAWHCMSHLSRWQERWQGSSRELAKKTFFVIQPHHFGKISASSLHVVPLPCHAWNVKVIKPEENAKMKYPPSHTNKAPGNGWLGDDPFILGPTYFQRIC